MKNDDPNRRKGRGLGEGVSGDKRIQGPGPEPPPDHVRISLENTDQLNDQPDENTFQNLSNRLEDPVQFMQQFKNDMQKQAFEGEAADTHNQEVGDQSPSEIPSEPKKEEDLAASKPSVQHLEQAVAKDEQSEASTGKEDQLESEQHEADEPNIFEQYAQKQEETAQEQDQELDRDDNER